MFWVLAQKNIDPVGKLVATGKLDALMRTRARRSLSLKRWRVNMDRSALRRMVRGLYEVDNDLPEVQALQHRLINNVVISELTDTVTVVLDGTTQDISVSIESTGRIDWQAEFLEHLGPHYFLNSFNSTLNSSFSELSFTSPFNDLRSTDLSTWIEQPVPFEEWPEP